MDYNKFLNDAFEFHKKENPFVKPDNIQESEWHANIIQYKRNHINMLYSIMDGVMLSIKDMMESDENIDPANRLNSILAVKEWFANKTFANYKREFLAE